jgi:hypothetical protein
MSFAQKTGESSGALRDSTSKQTRARPRQAASSDSIEESLQRRPGVQTQLRLRQTLNERPEVLEQTRLSADLSASRPAATVQRMYQPDTSEEAPQEDLKLRLATGLKAKYPGVQDDVLQALVSAKLTLMDRGYSEAKLLELQGEMASSGQDLDTVLSQAETSNEFAPRTVVDKVIDPGTFQALLRSQSQMFDIGTPPDHGPHTHRMQWYVLYKAFAEGKLPMKPVDLYAQMGGDALKDAPNYRTAWDDVFDFDALAGPLIGASGPQAEQAEKAAYSSPEWTLRNLAREGGPLGGGPLEQQLRRDRSDMSEFGGDVLLDPKEALSHGIAMKEVMKELLSPNDFPARKKELSDKEIPELREIYQQLKGGSFL